MPEHVLRARTRDPYPAAEGWIRFISLNLGGRGATRVRLDDNLVAAISRGGGAAATPDPTPTELSFMGSTEDGALALAQAWVRQRFEVVDESSAP